MIEFLSDGFRAATVVLLCIFGYTLIRQEKQSVKKNVFLLFLLTFQEIAFKMGYQSVATFNRAFKKEKSKTPSEYARVSE